MMFIRIVLFGLWWFWVRVWMMFNWLRMILCGWLKLSIVRVLVICLSGVRRVFSFEGWLWLLCMNRLRLFLICISFLYKVLIIECIVLWLGLVRWVCLVFIVLWLGSVLLRWYCFFRVWICGDCEGVLVM